MTIPTPPTTAPPQSVGFPITKPQVDQQIGNLARTIEQWASQAESFLAWLTTMPAEDLQAPPFGYTEDNVALLRSAANDLSTLARIYHGDEALPEARDLGVFARRTAGLF